MGNFVHEKEKVFERKCLSNTKQRSVEGTQAEQYSSYQIGIYFNPDEFLCTLRQFIYLSN